MANGFLKDFGRGILMQANENMKVRSERKNKRDEMIEARIQQAQLLDHEYTLKATNDAKAKRLEQELEDQKLSEMQDLMRTMLGAEGEEAANELGKQRGKLTATQKTALATGDIKTFSQDLDRSRERAEDQARADAGGLDTTFIEPIDTVVKKFEENDKLVNWVTAPALAAEDGNSRQGLDNQAKYLEDVARIKTGANAIMEASRRVNPQTGAATKESEIAPEEALTTALKIDQALQMLESGKASPEDKVVIIKELDAIAQAKPEFVRPFLNEERVKVLEAVYNEVQAMANPAPAATTEEAPVAPKAQPSQAAIDHLRANPGLAAAFEQKYGVPASTYLGQ